MAFLRHSEIKKLSKSELASKLTELRFELVKAQLPTSKTKMKTKEIKKSIARCLTCQELLSKSANKKEKAILEHAQEPKNNSRLLTLAKTKQEGKKK